jgi:hypothetical protein
MKRAVSISIGSSKRDKTVEIDLLGQRVRLERIGTDGDMEKAAQLYGELDGKVEAFGVGGADLGLQVDDKYYPLYSVQPMVRLVKKTPLVDGAGLRRPLEAKLGGFINSKLGDFVRPRRALVTSCADRWYMGMSFFDNGYECVFGDLMFALGLPFPIRTKRAVKVLAAILMPIAGRLPFKWVYPIGEKQEVRAPKWTRYYGWAKVIAGDAHYVKRHMPETLADKVVATNTTTPEDVEIFRKAGVKYLVTSTPRLEGRSFGTNVMEAAIVAAYGKGRALSNEEMDGVLSQLGLGPQLQELN